MMAKRPSSSIAVSRLTWAAEGVASVEAGELSVVSIDDSTDASSIELVLEVAVVVDGEG